MAYDPLKRDSSWTMVQPGCWIDPAGYGHIFPDEIVAEMQRQHPEAGFNFSKEDYEGIVATFVHLMRKRNPALQFVVAKHEREMD